MLVRLREFVNSIMNDAGMSCACPGRLEASRGIVEAIHAEFFCRFDSFELMSTQVDTYDSNQQFSCHFTGKGVEAPLEVKMR